MNKIILLSSTELPKEITKIMLRQGVVDVQSAISLLERLKSFESQSLLTSEQITACEQVFTPYMLSHRSTPVMPHPSFGVLDKDKFSMDESESHKAQTLTGKLTLQEIDCINNDEEKSDDE